MVQTLSADDIQRTYSPSVTDTLFAAHPGREHQRRAGQRLRPGPALSRLRGLAACRDAAGARRLSRRHPHQRGVRRHGELGPDPDQRHRPRRPVDQQSDVRPQRARRRRQHPDEERLHLAGLRGRGAGRLVRPPPGRAAVRRAEGRRRRLCRGAGRARRRLALPVALRHRPHLCRPRLEGRSLGIASDRARRVELVRCRRADAGRADRPEREVDLHLAADDRQPGGDARRSTASTRSPTSCRCSPTAMSATSTSVTSTATSPTSSAAATLRPFPNRLCLEDDGFPRPNPVTTAFRDQFVILDQFNNPIPCPPGSRQHLRAGALRHGRPHLDRVADLRLLGADSPAPPSCSATTTISSSARASIAATRAFCRTASSASSIPTCSSASTRPFPAPARSSTRSAMSATSRSA